MRTTRLLNILVNAHLTEKTSQVSGGYKQYAFEVVPDANKFEIRHSIEQLFKVKVRSVQTCRVQGKTRGNKGQTKDWKKAYVVLKQNQEIDLNKSS